MCHFSSIYNMLCPTEIRVCLTHGKTEYSVGKRKGGGIKRRCKKCRNEECYRRRIRAKEELVKLFGGRCQICGYDKYCGSLHFHHIDPSLKTGSIARLGTSKTLVKIEASRCVMVCANCHGEIENGLTVISQEIIDKNPFLKI